MHSSTPHNAYFTIGRKHNKYRTDYLIIFEGFFREFANGFLFRFHRFKSFAVKILRLVVYFLPMVKEQEMNVSLLALQYKSENLDRIDYTMKLLQ